MLARKNKDSRHCSSLLAVLIGFLAVAPQWASAQLDPRDPNRLSVAALEAAISQHDLDTRLLKLETGSHWDTLRQSLLNTTSDSNLRRILRSFDSDRRDAETWLARFQDHHRKMLERQLDVAQQQNGNAFGYVVPFFIRLTAVDDLRRDAAFPLEGAAEAVYIKRLVAGSRRNRALGELDLAVVVSGVDPMDVSRVRVTFLDVQTGESLANDTLSVYPFISPEAQAAAEPPAAHAGGIRIEVETQSSTGIDAAVLEEMILTGAVSIRIEVLLGSQGSCVLEGVAELLDLNLAPPSLKTLPIPTPPDLDRYVRDTDAAIALGKALFWDAQVSSSNTVACATCHQYAGADNRVTHQFAPSPNLGIFPGSGLTATWNDFPLADGLVFGSQGVIRQDFIGIDPNGGPDLGIPSDDTPIFGDATQVTQRQAPSVINAVYSDRQFWDGRAVAQFNGVNIWGDQDPDARVYQAGADGQLQPVRVSIDQASLASQAVGPPLSHVEMSWHGRTFPDIGRKLLSRVPLANQQVHPEDSVLGRLVDSDSQGLGVTYEELVRMAFQPEWWSGQGTVELSSGEQLQSYSHVEANFSLFFGLAVMLYEQTLVSDDSRYDQWREGRAALTIEEQKGLELFLNDGKCIVCHGGPNFSAAARHLVFEKPFELMPTKHFDAATYDNGFYNIGVTATAEDLGVGGVSPFGPLSYTLQEFANPGTIPNADIAFPSLPVALDGSHKTPTIRNVELTGPFMHNGKFASLSEVMAFYARGGDFVANEALDAEIFVIDPLLGNEPNQQAVIAFMKTLTDERVRWQRAPFDHPSLVIPNLGELPAVGSEGHSAPLTGFQSDLE